VILLIDNYDSFVYNLARYLEELGQRTLVCRNDALTVAAVEQSQPRAIVLSPGPCGPAQAGICVELVRRLSASVPILGVCLGHQCIAEAFGGRVGRAPEPVHGRATPVLHNGRGVFAGLAQPLRAARYHSLVVSADGLPDCLEVTATTQDHLVMALRHRYRPLVGVQFHPESILTNEGHRLLSNFLSCHAVTSALKATPSAAAGGALLPGR
jgi:anthranilate synthase/aminodeoxychorismate synthase-like glutamine amidotransferase